MYIIYHNLGNVCLKLLSNLPSCQKAKTFETVKNELCDTREQNLLKLGLLNDKNCIASGSDEATRSIYADIIIVR